MHSTPDITALFGTISCDKRQFFFLAKMVIVVICWGIKANIIFTVPCDVVITGVDSKSPFFKKYPCTLEMITIIYALLCRLQSTNIWEDHTSTVKVVNNILKRSRARQDKRIMNRNIVWTGIYIFVINKAENEQQYNIARFLDKYT